MAKNQQTQNTQKRRRRRRKNNGDQFPYYEVNDLRRQIKIELFFSSHQQFERKSICTLQHSTNSQFCSPVNIIIAKSLLKNSGKFLQSHLMTSHISHLSLF